jgi:hypothetical protein
MRLKRMECPNCGGQVRKEADGKYLCESCGSPFVMDMDPEDVEYERVKLEQEKLKNSPPVYENRYARKQSVDPQVMAQRRRKVKVVVITLVIIYVVLPMFTMLIGGIFTLVTGIPLKSSSKKKDTTRSTIPTSRFNKSTIYSNANTATPTPAPVYVTDPDAILSDTVFTTNMLEAAEEKIESFKTEKVPYGSSFRATGSGFVSAYLVNSDEGAYNRFENRIYLVYRISWENDENEKIDEFFPVYLNNITVMESGVIQSDYLIQDDFRFTMKSPRIFYGFDSEKQFYREELLSMQNVTISGFDPVEHTEEPVEEPEE